MKLDSPIFNALHNAAARLKAVPIPELFRQNPGRFQEFSLEACDLLLDFSKNIIDREALDLLLALLEQTDFTSKREHLFTGGCLNFTENRAVLHTALRDHNLTIPVNGNDISSKIQANLARMFQLVDQVYAQKWLGFSGKAITDVVNIGIGGSDLGPRMATFALTPFHQEGKVQVHFVANIDGHDLLQVLKKLSPETTLFIVSSKTFSTIETLTNAETAKQWLCAGTNSPEVMAKHFVAVTMNTEKAKTFGIPAQNIFAIWDWVGGRFSLWSAIGLPILFAIGKDNFKALLSGAAKMDQHFRHAELRQNMPVLLALLGFWYIHFFGANNYAVLPYDFWLQKFPAFLQQLDMESNGKSANQRGEYTNYGTGPIVWGDMGTNGQHAFFQLLHQSAHFVPLDFIIAANPHHALNHHHEILFANFLAQTKSLMEGSTKSDIHKHFPGNKPSNAIVLPQLTPENLGALIALYEHKIFTQGILWEINSFDQWGVELGKEMAIKLLPAVKGELDCELDGSTAGLLKFYQDRSAD